MHAAALQGDSLTIPLLASGSTRSRCWTPPGTCRPWVSRRPGTTQRSCAPLFHVTDYLASLLLTHAGRDAAAEFSTERITGAQFWDIDGVCDPASSLPHMLPSEEAFAAAADALGISNDDAVVVYDGMGMFAAPRAWWTWRVYGHDR